MPETHKPNIFTLGEVSCGMIFYIVFYDLDERVVLEYKVQLCMSYDVGLKGILLRFIPKSCLFENSKNLSLKTTKAFVDGGRKEVEN